MHSPEAMQAAEIIMNRRMKIDTLYGKKTLLGVADLIDRCFDGPPFIKKPGKPNAVAELVRQDVVPIDKARTLMRSWKGGTEA